MNYLQQLVDEIKNTYPSLTEVLGIGRQNDKGIIIIDNKEFGGITDKRDNYAYIRFRGSDDWRHERSTRRRTSAPSWTATAELRLVVVHREENASEFVRGLAQTMTGKFSCNPSASVEIDSIDEDRNRILEQETAPRGNQSLDDVYGKWNNAVRLARIDFTLSYHYTGVKCDPVDLCGGGTQPTPIICPTLCEQIEDAQVVEIIGCLSEEQEDEIKALICPAVGADATYQNSDGTFSVDIPSGDTFVAPDITVTEADGSETATPSNKDFECAYPVARVRSTDGVYEAVELTSYPSGGNADVLEVEVQDGTGIGNTVTLRPEISFSLAIVTNIQVLPNRISIGLVIFNILNSDGFNLKTVGGYTSQAQLTVPDIPLLDDNGTFNTLPTPARIQLVGEIDTATYNNANGRITITPLIPPCAPVTIEINSVDEGTVPSGDTAEINLVDDNSDPVTPTSVTKVGNTFTVEVPAGGASSGIVYQGLHCLNNKSFYPCDSFDMAQKGHYNHNQPTAPATVAQIDWEHDDAPTMLINDNKWGNKYRFTDLDGDPATGAGQWGHVDWENHTFPSGKVNLVKDHYLGLIIPVNNLTLDGGIDMDVGASGIDWFEMIDAIDALTDVNGISNLKWLPIPIDSRLPHMAKAARAESGNAGMEWVQNFFITDISNKRFQIPTGETEQSNPDDCFYILRDSGVADVVAAGGSVATANGIGALKAGGTSFVFRINRFFVVAVDKDDEY